MRRGDGTWSRYAVETEQGMTILGLLVRIYEDLDPTLAFDRHFCKLGTCTCCLVSVDGKPRLGCRTMVPTSGEIRLEPVTGHAVLRDLLIGPRV